MLTLRSPKRSPPHGGADRNILAADDRHGYERRPLTGARIETVRECLLATSPGVAPSRGRGSKHLLARGLRSLPSRPLTGARIETRHSRRGDGGCAVAPSRGRGSKRSDAKARRLWKGSPPHGGADRNLNWEAIKEGFRVSPPHGGADRNDDSVGWFWTPRGRPLTGARIETLNIFANDAAGNVAPSRGRGSKHAASQSTKGD